MKITSGITIFLLAFLLPYKSGSQEKSLESFLSDSSMFYASVSLCIADATSGQTILDHNSGKSLIPGSVVKLISSASALELLGPYHTFKTSLGYTGIFNKRTGRLSGNIVIKGGGDPALGSKNFADHYGDFLMSWIEEIKKLGIKRIDGKIITDDSYYDYQPVPPKWLWEDPGNYYGAGVYGLSVFDNTYEIHFKTSSRGTPAVITKVVPGECGSDLSNRLLAEGNTDKGYVFAAPYSKNGWIAGTIPVNRDEFILKASITDPPLLLAEILCRKLDSAGIIISGTPTTTRLENPALDEETFLIDETVSPPLKDIIEILNHESVNLYAEHLVKELGKLFRDKGSTSSGIEVIKQYLDDSGISSAGLFIEDGSGLSPLNALNSREFVNFLLHMKKNGKYFTELISSLPDAGKEGTLKNYFKDPVFDSNLKAKSGSMTRIRSYAGYFTTLSGKEVVFSIIINNYTGTTRKIISGIEEILKETILHK